MKRSVISFHYLLTDKSGQTLDTSRGGEPLVFLEGSGQIIEGLESAIVNKPTGHRERVQVPFLKAYGAYDDQLISKAPRNKFPGGDIKVGEMYRVGGPEGFQIVTVVEVTDTDVTVDGNHPLAGKDLTFDIEIVEVREATNDEIMHGHVHGAGGHQH